MNIKSFMCWQRLIVIENCNVRHSRCVDLTATESWVVKVHVPFHLTKAVSVYEFSGLFLGSWEDTLVAKYLE